MLAIFGFGDHMNIALVTFGVGVVALAIMAKLTARRQRSWVERDLQRGDLSFLTDFVSLEIAAPFPL